MDPRNTLKSTCRSLIGSLALLLPTWAGAQVSLYQFSTSVEIYTEITDADGGYSLATPTWDPPLFNLRAFVDPAIPNGTVTMGGYLSPAIGPGYPIGFDMTYNGDVFDRIAIAHGGWISFGKSSDGNQAVWCFTSDHPAGRPLNHSYGGPPIPYQRNRVAGWGSSSLQMQDMSPLVPPGPVSSLRVATIGTAPNRVCVIQWKDFRSNYSVDNYRINFQIRLYESTNVVDVRFGPVEFGYSGAAAQIGLGGRTNEDFSNRVVVYGEPAFLYDWNNTTAGTINTEYMIASPTEPGQPNGSGVVPVLGRTYRWTPAACAPPAWPLELLSNGLGYFEMQWPGLPDAVAYDYVVTTSPDPAAPSPAAEGTLEEPYLLVEGLDTMTTYYVYVRTVCADGPGIWGNPTEFRSAGGAILVCGEPPLVQYHCYPPLQKTTWYYSTSDGFSPIRVNFTGGAFTSDARFRVYDGADTTAAVLWDSSVDGALPGRSFTTTGASLTLKMIGHPTAGCSNVEFLLPIQWTLGCKDCTDPLVNFALGDVDCAAQQYFVDVNVFSMGSAVELSLQNDVGVPPVTVNATGIHSVGPFTAGLPVIITASNPLNTLCNVVASPFVNDPCPILDCGPTWYDICLGEDEVRTWLFQGDGQPVGVRFLPGSMGFDAQINSFNGPDDLSPQLAMIGGTTNNEIRRSANAGNALLVQYAASTYPDYSCVLGNTLPLKFVVGCIGTCEQPNATFTYADCIEAATFNIVVNVTSLGSGGPVVIDNDGGAPVVAVPAIGQYTVGPFASGSTVRIHVKGANDLCTWSSSLMSRSCAGVSVEELKAGEPIKIYPNPNDGNFRVTLPTTFSSRSILLVVDITGRVCDQRKLNGISEVALDLTHLPSGLYTLVLQGEVQQASDKISIQH